MDYKDIKYIQKVIEGVRPYVRQESICAVNVINFIEVMGEYDLWVDDETHKMVVDAYNAGNYKSGKADNTYNRDGVITNDLNIEEIIIDDSPYVLVDVHLTGDIRGGYYPVPLVYSGSFYQFIDSTGDTNATSASCTIDVDGKTFYIDSWAFQENQEVLNDEFDNIAQVYGVYTEEDAIREIKNLNYTKQDDTPEGIFAMEESKKNFRVLYSDYEDYDVANEEYFSTEKEAKSRARDLKKQGKPFVRPERVKRNNWGGIEDSYPLGESRKLKESAEDAEIKQWYMQEFPEDREARHIKDGVTFMDLFEALDSYQDIYGLLGDGIDSFIRENIFIKLAEIMGVDYDYIYNQWLMAPTVKGESKVRKEAYGYEKEIRQNRIVVTGYETFDEAYEALIDYLIENYGYEDGYIDGEPAEEMEYWDEWSDIVYIEDSGDMESHWRENGWTLDRGYGGPDYKEKVADGTDWDSIFDYIVSTYEYDDVFGGYLITPTKLNDLVIFWDDDNDEEEESEDDEDDEYFVGESKRINESHDMYNYVSENYYKMSLEELRTIVSEALYQLYDNLDESEYTEANKAIGDIYLDTYGENPSIEDIYKLVTEEYMSMSRDELRLFAVEAIYQIHERLDEEGYNKAMASIQEVYDETYSETPVEESKHVNEDYKRSDTTWFELQAEGKSYDIKAYSQGTRNGFKHVGSLIDSSDMRTISSTSINYLNRTWERFEYESLIRKLVSSYFGKNSNEILNTIVNVNYKDRPLFKESSIKENTEPITVTAIRRNYDLSSYGTSGMGYVEHRGITVELSNGQYIFGYYGYSSKAYGTWKEMNPSNYYGLNGRFLSKYSYYEERVNKHFTELMGRLEKELVGKQFNRVSQIKSILRNA